MERDIRLELWREIESERETAYLLQSETMKRRLLEAKERTNSIPTEDILHLAAQVYDGLSEQDVRKVEQIAFIWERSL